MNQVFKFAGILLALALLVAGAAAWRSLRRQIEPGATGHRSYSVDDRLAEYGERVDARLKPYFSEAGVDYPPEKLVLVGLKAERRLLVYAGQEQGPMKFVCACKILGASGVAGPKLREGDSQVPEGIYRIDSLNPNSLYHLSLRIGYPNAWDREHALADGRADLGGDIMIHGGSGSVGCLAMGDPAAEDLFVLAARTGLQNIRVLLCPVDLRVQAAPQPGPTTPAWTGTLYAKLKSELADLPPAPAEEGP